MITIVGLLFLPLLFLFSNQASALNTTYYLDATLGNDTWTGQVVNGDFLPDGCEDDANTSDCSNGPWKTIAKVNTTTLGAGDRVLLKKGQTWNEQLTIVNSGTLGNPIYVGAYGTGENPIIDAQNTRSYAITFGALSYITLESLQVRNATSRNIWSDGAANGIVLNEINSTGGGTGIWIRSKSNSSYTNITVTGATIIYGFNLSNAATNVTVGNINAASNVNIGIGLNNITNLTADNLTATNNTSFGISMTAITGTLTASNLVAGGGVGLGNSSYGINFKGCSNLVYDLEDITTSYNNNVGFFIEDIRTGTVAGTLTNLLTERNNSDGMRVTYINNLDVNNSISRYNTNAGGGFSLITENNNVNFYDSVANNNVWDGFSIKGIGSSFAFARDLAYSNGTVGQVNSGDGFTSHDSILNVKIENSIGYNNLNSGFAVMGTSTGTVYNSTFYNNGSAGFNRGGYWSQLTGSGTYTLKNNIFSDNYPRELSLDVNGATRYVANNNAYYHPDNINFASFDDGATAMTWANYHTSLGRETDSLYGEPDFVNSAEADFGLRIDSVAIDMAVDDNIAPELDYLGSARFDAPSIINTGSGEVTYYDAGATEYRVPSTPNITSNTHTDETMWYANSTPEIHITTPTTDSVHYHYLINQTSTPLLSEVASGTEDMDGVFAIADGVINSQGTWYVHVIAQNSSHEPSASYDTYTINYAELPSFDEIDGEVINITEGQTIRENPFIIRVKPDSFLGIGKVEFYVDDVLIGTDNNADVEGIYEYPWDTSKYHSEVRVIAYDTENRASDPILRSTTVSLLDRILDSLPSAGTVFMFYIISSFVGAVAILVLERKKATVMARK